jgi:hypothetical protein
MACGTSVVAFAAGGATETVLGLDAHAEPTGMFFNEQTAECLSDSLQTFEQRASELNPAAARRRALRFNAPRFAEELFAFLDSVITPSTEATRRAA